MRHSTNENLHRKKANNPANCIKNTEFYVQITNKRVVNLYIQKNTTKITLKERGRDIGKKHKR